MVKARLHGAARRAHAPVLVPLHMIHRSGRTDLERISTDIRLRFTVAVRVDASELSSPRARDPVFAPHSRPQLGASAMHTDEDDVDALHHRSARITARRLGKIEPSSAIIPAPRFAQHVVHHDVAGGDPRLPRETFRVRRSTPRRSAA